jgi:hypothetical protein
VVSILTLEPNDSWSRDRQGVRFFFRSLTVAALLWVTCLRQSGHVDSWHHRCQLWTFEILK